MLVGRKLPTEYKKNSVVGEKMDSSDVFWTLFGSDDVFYVTYITKLKKTEKSRKSRKSRKKSKSAPSRSRAPKKKGGS